MKFEKDLKKVPGLIVAANCSVHPDGESKCCRVPEETLEGGKFYEFFICSSFCD